MRGVNFLRQVVRPLVGITLSGSGNRQFGAQGSHFTVRVEEAGNDLIADVQVITRNLAAERFAPLRFDTCIFIRRYVASVTEINVNGLVETIRRIRNFQTP